MTATLRLGIVAIVSATMLSGCFTGIESTPRISDNDVKRQNIVETPEDTYLNDVVPDSSESSKIGHQWIVTDSKIKLVLDPSAAQYSIQPGDTLTLVALTDNRRFDGQHVADALLADTRGNRFTYRTNLTVDNFKSGTKLEIPFTVDCPTIENVRRKMEGKTYYITTPTRYDMNGNLYTGRRFVAVRIDTVSYGNVYYPICLVATDDLGQQFKLYMSVESQSKMPRKFASMFSLSNPRKRYPTVTDENWNLIVNGKVSQGMTRDECRLALGKPDNVDRQMGYSVVREIWTYENGRYLLFIDGLLETYRQ